MHFPELHSAERNSMKPSKEFLLGLPRRIFGKVNQKVFVIGFHKTGTSSMGKALQLLGYRVCGSLKEGYDYKQQEGDTLDYLVVKAAKMLHAYDAFQDTPWFLMYRSLYQKFPKAKFILTVRDEVSWIGSVQSHFGRDAFPYHEYIYGATDALTHPRKFVEKYRAHNTSVVEFFKDNRGQLLVFNIEECANKWEVLCDFLAVKKPLFKFPHANPKRARNSISYKIKRFLKKLYYR